MLWILLAMMAIAAMLWAALAVLKLITSDKEWKRWHDECVRSREDKTAD